MYVRLSLAFISRIFLANILMLNQIAKVKTSNEMIETENLKKNQRFGTWETKREKRVKPKFKHLMFFYRVRLRATTSNEIKR